MLKKILPYLAPHRSAPRLGIGQVFLIAGFELLKPWPLQVVIDNYWGASPLH